MATIGIVDAADRYETLERLLLPLLPALGYERWLRLDPAVSGVADPELVNACTALLIVLSDDADIDDVMVRALASGPPTVGLRIGGARDDTLPVVALPGDALPGDPRRSSMVMVELQGDSEADWVRVARDLGDLLPAVDSAMEYREPDAGLPIGWSERAFSEHLFDATFRRDVDRLRALVGALERHAEGRDRPYPAEDANRDLGRLRGKRQFELLCRAGAALIGSGTNDFKTFRLYAQGLIELKRFDEALRVLENIIARSHAEHEESLEARGLVGRVHKQRYVDDDPDGPEAERQLLSAIDAYLSVYRQNGTIWHGINASTLLLRAHRDFWWPESADRGREIAAELCETLEARRASGDLKYAFDYATLVEALVNSGRFDDAARALEEYLEHPDLDAFEVSSTHRQFDEVLQLGMDERGASLLERLWKAVERFRAGGLRLGGRAEADAAARHVSELAAARGAEPDDRDPE